MIPNNLVLTDHFGTGIFTKVPEKSLLSHVLVSMWVPLNEFIATAIDIDELYQKQFSVLNRQLLALEEIGFLGTPMNKEATSITCQAVNMATSQVVRNAIHKDFSVPTLSHRSHILDLPYHLLSEVDFLTYYLNPTGNTMSEETVFRNNQWLEKLIDPTAKMSQQERFETFLIKTQKNPEKV